MEKLDRFNILCIKNKQLLTKYENLFNQHLNRYNKINKKSDYDYDKDNEKYDFLDEPKIILNYSKSIYNKIKNFTDNTDISNDSKRIIDNIKSLSKKSNDIFKNLNNIFGEEDEKREDFIPIIAYAASKTKVGKNTINSISKVTPKPVKNVVNTIDKGVTSITPKPVRDALNTVDKGVTNAVQKVEKGVTDGISKIPGVEGVKHMIVNIFEYFKKMLSVFDDVLKTIKNIASKAGSKINSILDSLFKSMISIFDYIKNVLVPNIIKTVKKITTFIKTKFNYIIKNAPRFYNYIKYKLIVFYKEYKPKIKFLIANAHKTILISIILFIFIYINLRTVTKYITGDHDFTPPPLTVPIPFSGSVNVYFPSVNSVISFIIVAHTLFYHNKKLLSINNKIMSFFKQLLNLQFIQKLMNIKNDKKSKSYQDSAKKNANRAAMIIKLIMRNLPKIILFVIVILIIFKTLMNKSFRSFVSIIDNKVSNVQF